MTRPDVVPPALAPVRSGQPRVHTEIEPTLGRKAWFGWFGFWAFFFVATMSPGVVIHSAIKPGVKAFRAWMRPWGRFVLALGGMRLRVEMSAPVPEPAVYVSNHQNGLDVPVLSAGLPTPFVFGAKTELREWPFVGWVLERTACVFIDRSGPKKALASLQEAAGRIRGGTSVLLFPEGGRSWRHGLLPFMRGPFILAIESGVPVVPVAIVGNAGVLDEKKLLARRGTVRLVIGDPIPTAGMTRRDASALSDRVETWIAAQLSAVAPLRLASGEIDERRTENERA